MKIKDLPIENNPVNNGYLVYDDPAGTLTSKTEVNKITPWEKGTENYSAQVINSGSVAISAYSIAQGQNTIAGIRMFTIDSTINGLITISGYGDLTAIFQSGMLYFWDGTYLLELTYNSINYSAPNFTIQLDDITKNFGDFCIDINEINNSLANITAVGDQTHAEGNSTKALTYNSHAEGFMSISIGESSHAQNKNTKSVGEYSHSGGNGGNEPIIAQGNCSFNHSENTIQDPGKGAIGNNSAILGGQNGNVTGARSVLLGGTKRTEADNDTTNVQELRITNNIKITTGSNKPCDTVTLNGTGTLTVNNSLVKTGAKIFLTFNTLGGVNDHLSVPDASIVNGVSFNIISHANDTSTVNYLIINP